MRPGIMFSVVFSFLLTAGPLAASQLAAQEPAAPTVTPATLQGIWLRCGSVCEAENDFCLQTKQTAPIAFRGNMAILAAPAAAGVNDIPGMELRVSGYQVGEGNVALNAGETAAGDRSIPPLALAAKLRSENGEPRLSLTLPGEEEESFERCQVKLRQAGLLLPLIKAATLHQDIAVADPSAATVHLLERDILGQEDGQDNGSSWFYRPLGLTMNILHGDKIRENPSYAVALAPFGDDRKAIADEKGEGKDKVSLAFLRIADSIAVMAAFSGEEAGKVPAKTGLRMLTDLFIPGNDNSYENIRALISTLDGKSRPR